MIYVDVTLRRPLSCTDERGLIILQDTSRAHAQHKISGRKNAGTRAEFQEIDLRSPRCGCG